MTGQHDGDTNTEWGVMQRSRPGLHRGPMSRDEAESWVKDAEDDGFRPGAFYVVRRDVGPWGRAEAVTP